jgi:manganese transport protein
MAEPGLGRSGDRRTVAAAAEVLAGQGRRGPLGRLLPFLGPAVVASVAYVDPGNFATTIQGGARFGTTLLWVVVASNLMAMLVQALAAKLGIATGLNLAEHCRDRFPPWLTFTMWALMEVVAMATDLAEFLGAALGFHLLFGLPLGVAGLVTAAATFLILGLQRYGFRPLEAVITAFVGVIALVYLVEVFLARPAWGAVAHDAVVPQFRGRESVLLAAGIVGATVMPHVIFLHSALTQGRLVVRHPDRLRRLFRYQIADVTVAMTVAGLINAAMLIVAASTFHRSGLTETAGIEQAHATLRPLLGRGAAAAFGIALLAAGLSSSAVGTMAGQVIMQGFLRRRIPVLVRRLVTMAPSLVVIAVGFDLTRTLVLSQVVLSFGLPFALVPLVLFTRRRDVMGVLVNRPLTTVAATVITALVVALNVYLLYRSFVGG